MATTAARITDDRGLVPFYVLRIHGLPYHLCGTVNPYDARWGASAWSLGTGYTAITGLDLPDDRMEQQITDLVGCVATAERLRVAVKDAKQANGTWIFGRIFATGRALTDTTVAVGTLNDDLPADAGEGDTFSVRTADTFADSGDLCVGSETLSYSEVHTSANISTFTILERNKYPASAAYPPPNYYRVFRDSNGVVLPDRNVVVTGNASGTVEPLSIVGRIASLTIGHVRPQGGSVEAEDQALVRTIGQIVGLKYKAGRFEIEIESITAQLASDGLCVAPDLARADIPTQIILSDLHWRSFIIGLQTGDTSDGSSTYNEVAISVSNTSYTGSGALTALVRDINAALLAKKDDIASYCHLEAVTLPGGEVRYAFHGLAPNLLAEHFRFYVSHGIEVAVVGAQPGRGSGSLLSVLGFPDDQAQWIADDPGTFNGADANETHQYIVAPNPAAQLFIPTASQGTNQIHLAAGTNELYAPGNRFFTDQGDGSGRAWCRLGNGDIVQVLAHDATTITTGNRLAPLSADFLVRPLGFRTFYAIPSGDNGTVEQVVFVPDGKSYPPPGPVLCVGRLLASTSGAAADDVNVYPEGVGLGFDGIIDKASFRQDETEYRRRWIIDATTTFQEIWKPIAKEYGLFLVWDPAVGQVALRKLRVPSPASASTYAFTESNRHEQTELTDTVSDSTHVRTGWTLEWGWSQADKKPFGSISFTEQFGHAVFGADVKHEKIQDKSLVYAESAGAMLANLAGRSLYYRYPWIRCRRTLNKTGLLLAPGTFHKVVDASIHNPFTGVLGITTADNIYAFLTRVAANLAAGASDAPVEIEYLINGIDPYQQFRPWAPTAYVDRASGTHGYTAASKTLYLSRWYTDNSDASKKDGVDFAAGYKVRIMTMDNDGAPTYSDDTIVSVASDGSSVVLTTGLSSDLQTALVTLEAMMIFQPYTSSNATQEAAVSWLGSAVDGLIQATARNTKWS